MMKVLITLPANHPQSEEALQAISCPECRERARQQMAAYTLLCPFCLGMLPAEAKYCAWCTQLVRVLAN
jgi:hypothetical protein